MKIYKVKVNGKVYEVELESVTEQAGSIALPAQASVAAPAAVAPAANAVQVVSPMQGTILSVKVNVGDAVKKGQVVAILEAMKLENEIVSTAEGTVRQVLVTANQTVNAQQAIIVVG